MNVIDYKNAYEMLPVTYKRIKDKRKAVDKFVLDYPEYEDELPYLEVSEDYPLLLYKTSTASTIGCLSKGWFTDGVNNLLVKGNSDGEMSLDGIPGFEPFSEVFASKLGQILDFNVVTYELSTTDVYSDIHTYERDYVSVCKEYPIEQNEESYTAYKLAEAIYRDKVKSFTFDDYEKFWHKLGIDLQQIYNMFLLDAITGNTDRHLNNFDFIRYNGNVRLAPTLDFGLSCLSLYGNERLRIWPGIGPDKAKPFAKTHTKQLQLFKDMKKPKSLGVFEKWESEVKNELNELPGNRRIYIKNYIKHRLEVFLK